MVIRSSSPAYGLITKIAAMGPATRNPTPDNNEIFASCSSSVFLYANQNTNPVATVSKEIIETSTICATPVNVMLVPLVFTGNQPITSPSNPIVITNADPMRESLLLPTL